MPRSQFINFFRNELDQTTNGLFVVNRSTEEQERVVRRVFNELDTNHNNRIDKKEKKQLQNKVIR